MPKLDIKEYIHILAEESAVNLTSPSPENIEKEFRVGDVIFNNVNGMGSVPDCQRVNYMGFTGFMLPKSFRDLAYPENRIDDATRMADEVRKGATIGTPFLSVLVNYDEYKDGKEPFEVKVMQHEGRARSLVCDIINGPNVPIPVAFFLRQEYRARHLDEEFFVLLRKEGICPQRQSVPINPHISKIFWGGKVL